MGGIITSRADIADEVTNEVPKASLWFLFLTFLKIGSIAFGGFMALISVIESHIVERYRLLGHKEMLDGISLANLLPGPIAVNVVAFIGYRLRGPVGAIVVTTAVLLPSFIMLLVLSYLYFQYGQIPALQKAFQGFIPAVAAIVFSVAWRLGKKKLNGIPELLITIASATLLVLTPREYKVYAPLIIIACSAIIGLYLFKEREAETQDTQASQSFSWHKPIITLICLAVLVTLWFIPLPLENNSLLLLTLTFASMSLMLFGGGFVFIPIIGSIVVLKYGWVTQQEFTDGIAMGQITPGPILISASFIGYKVAGFAGATLATLAIYTPPAILMITASQALDFIQRSAATRAAMHAIHCGVIGMIFIAAFVILHTAIPGLDIPLAQLWPTLFILTASLFALIKLNIDVVWVIPSAGILGYLFY